MRAVKTINLDISLGELELALNKRELSKDELAKYKNELLGGERLKNELEDLSRPDVEKDLKINLKPNGIYIQFDRELIKKSVREWSFMVRDTVWGGGDISAGDWLQYSRLADLYSKADDGSSSIRLTTRQNFQFHRVSKKNLVPLIKSLIKIGKPSLNGCGDNTRNPVACPHKSDIFNANELAQKIGKYFQLPLSEHYKIFGEKYIGNRHDGFNYSEYGLPRKFKIGIGGYYYDEELKKEVRCNCGDILTNDLAIVPIIKNKKVNGYQIYIGGGLGQKNGKPTFPSLAGPLGILPSEEALMKGLDAIVAVQQQIGDRKNRHWARLKNILISKGLEKSGHSFETILLDEAIFNEVRDLGIKWFKEQLESLGVCFLPSITLELGKLNKHHGWKKQLDGKWSFGIWIQNGRISDTNPQGKVKSLIDEIVSSVKPNVRIAPTQDILFTDIHESSKNILEEILKKYNYGKYSKLRLSAEACVGLYTCPLAVSESERYFHPLISELEQRGYSNVEGVSIGISGCERHCSRNIRYGISIEGKGDSFYQLKLLLGKTEDAHLAQDIIHDNQKYLKLIPKNEIPNLISVLIDNYRTNKNPDENEISVFHQRIGIEKILESLKTDEKISHLLEKTYDPFLT
jgi:sulfite reductase (NADPH) hemoprotein beta-component